MSVGGDPPNGTGLAPALKDSTRNLVKEEHSVPAEKQLDLLILGTGPAASRIVYNCREAGWEVGIADPRPFGGTCGLRG